MPLMKELIGMIELIPIIVNVEPFNLNGNDIAHIILNKLLLAWESKDIPSLHTGKFQTWERTEGWKGHKFSQSTLLLARNFGINMATRILMSEKLLNGYLHMFPGAKAKLKEVLSRLESHPSEQKGR
jgi:hypothetical protein